MAKDPNAYEIEMRPQNLIVKTKISEKHIKNYNGLVVIIKKLEIEKEKFLAQVATAYNLTPEELLIDFKALNLKQHDEIVKEFNEEYQLTNTKLYCKMGSKLL